MTNNSRGDNIFLKFEVQEMEMRDLRTEVTNLKEMIKVKNEENAKLKTTLKSQEIMLNSVKEIVEKCSNQVLEVVSEQSTSTVLSESEPRNSTLNATKEDMTSGSSSPCLPTPSSVTLKSPPITPVIVSSSSIPPMKSKVPPADRSRSLSTEVGNQPDGKHHEDPWSDRVSRDSPMIDVNGHTVGNKQNVSNLGNFEGNNNIKKTCVKFKIARSDLIDIGPLLTDGSGKSPERVLRNKKLKETNESEEQIDGEYEVDKIIAYKVELGKKLYKVRWSLGDTTWEDVTNLTNCNLAIKEFWKSRSKKTSSSNECVRHIRFKVRCQETDFRGEKVPGIKFSVKETCTVGEVKKKYRCKLNVDVEQLVWKGRTLQDDENVQGLEGEVVNAIGVTWK